MSAPVHSQSWYSVAPLRPRLLGSVRCQRQVYRGQVWFSLHEPGSGRVHRVTPGARRVLERLDGRTTLQAIWDDLGELDSEDAATQQEIVDLLGQLHQHDLLDVDAEPEAAEVLARYRKRRWQPWKQFLLNPVSLKLPLLDPTPALKLLVPLLGPLWSRAGFALWLLVVAPAAALAAINWNELTGNLSDRVLSTGNLFILAAVYPLAKLLHEFGHAIAARRFGAHVGEMGVIFMALAPIPYVDASAASALRSRRQRAIVGASGMLVELFVAALAMYAWLLLEPSALRAAAFNLMLIAGVSTLLVNGNPLARFDGYFILCDLIEIPNLGQRGSRYWTALSDRWLFGARDLPLQRLDWRERLWLLAYTPASWIYRIFLTLSIAAFVATRFFTIGIVLALWAVISLVAQPAWKAARHLVRGPSLRRVRASALRRALALSAAVVLALLIVPLPSRTVSEGVIWLQDELTLRAPEAGRFEAWLADPGQQVKPGEPVARLVSDDLTAALRQAIARRDEARAKLRAERFSTVVQGADSAAALEHEERQVAQLERRLAALSIPAVASGRLLAQSPQDFGQRMLKQGEVIGHVFDPARLYVRVALSQSVMERVRDGIEGARIRLAGATGTTLESKVIREVPANSERLPSPALGTQGGGPFATRPDDEEGTAVTERVVWMDLSLPPDARPGWIGSRAWVRFDHPPESLARAFSRRLRQALLAHLPS